MSHGLVQIPTYSTAIGGGGGGNAVKYNEIYPVE